MHAPRLSIIFLPPSALISIFSIFSKILLNIFTVTCRSVASGNCFHTTTSLNIPIIIFHRYLQTVHKTLFCRMAFQTDSPADNQHAFPFHPTDHCYCLLSAFLYYASKSAILNLLIIPRRLSASLLICWLAAAHCWEVAEFVCTTSLI